uniref:Uncharacterized protein n=1 Tax=Monodon monoceros TaxID=40151 RepID=A0A8C6BCC3_MONMO
LFNIKFNVTDSATLKGTCEANTGRCGLNVLHCFYTCIHILLSPQTQTQGLLSGDFKNYCHLCKITYRDQVV